MEEVSSTSWGVHANFTRHISFRGFKVLSPLCSLLTSMLCMFCETNLWLYTVSPIISRLDTHPICIFNFFDFYMCTPVLLPPHPFIYESLLLSHVFGCSLKKHPGCVFQHWQKVQGKGRSAIGMLGKDLLWRKAWVVNYKFAYTIFLSYL